MNELFHRRFSHATTNRGYITRRKLSRRATRARIFTVTPYPNTLFLAARSGRGFRAAREPAKSGKNKHKAETTFSQKEQTCRAWRPNVAPRLESLRARAGPRQWLPRRGRSRARRPRPSYLEASFASLTAACGPPSARAPSPPPFPLTLRYAKTPTPHSSIRFDRTTLASLGRAPSLLSFQDFAQRFLRGGVD